MRMFLETVSGNEIRSDVILDENGNEPDKKRMQAFVEEAEEMFRDFSTLAHIFMTVAGVKKYYNPRNIVSACVR